MENLTWEIIFFGVGMLIGIFMGVGWMVARLDRDDWNKPWPNRDES